MAISDHGLVCLTFELKAPRARCKYVLPAEVTRTLLPLNNFIQDQANGAFHMVNFFDVIDQEHALSRLLLDVLNKHALLNDIETIKSSLSHYITLEIRGLMKHETTGIRRHIKGHFYWIALLSSLGRGFSIQIRIAEKEYSQQNDKPLLSEKLSNTRPTCTSFLLIVSKVIERASHSQFVDYLDCNQIIGHHQNGKRKVTETALFFLTG